MASHSVEPLKAAIEGAVVQALNQPDRWFNELAIAAHEGARARLMLPHAELTRTGFDQYHDEVEYAVAGTSSRAHPNMSLVPHRQSDRTAAALDSARLANTVELKSVGAL